MAEKENSSPETPSLIPSLPEDIIIDILARVSRWEYPTLSLVSKQFQSLVASPELYARRSLLGCTEHCLYVVLCEGENKRWYTLRRNANGNRSLVRIPSLPPLTRGESFLAVGSKIYVFGGTNDTSDFSIYCRSHTVQPLPSMPLLPMSDTRAAIIDDKIYVMGRLGDFQNLIVLFNTKTNMWEPEILKPDIELHGERRSLDSCLVGGWLVLANKMYVNDFTNYCLIYDPKENIWRPDDTLRSVKMPTACVIDDILYYFPTFLDFTDNDDYVAINIRTYDPKRSCWGVVKGLNKLFSKMKSFRCIHAANYGGKLALFYSGRYGNYCTRYGNYCTRRDVRSKKKIWYAEILLERRHGGKIWGTVEWCGKVLVAEDSCNVLKCLNVIV
ncbi:F-box/kelch-repeat protein [Raphanus sativus]|nr:F-box/kelch-repeat protein [Raphanus sativus]